jgi:hypothetical protein
LKNYKSYKKVSDSFSKKVENGLYHISSSLKFEEILSTGHKINPNDRVFITYRTINNKEEMFELHYDISIKKILDIFLVS